MAAQIIILCIFLIQISYLVPGIASAGALPAAKKVPTIIIFGDSSVDTGNNNQISTVLKSNFQPYGRDFVSGQPTGRFCNGRIAIDFISEAFGLKPTVPAYLDPKYSIKDFATGVSFASAGTGLDNITSSFLNVIPIWKEVEYFRDYIKKLKAYVGEREARRRLSEALYVISVGTNDFLENYYLLPTRRSQFGVAEFQDFLVGLYAELVMEIYRLGGRKISATGLLPMGCLPLERGTNVASEGKCNEEYNEVALGFNGKLKGKVEEMRRKVRGIKVVFTNVYYKWLEITTNPSLFGIDNTARGCCGIGIFEMGYICDRWNPFTCTDANKYAFWDAFHPTEKVYRILADHVMKTALAEFL